MPCSATLSHIVPPLWAPLMILMAGCGATAPEVEDPVWVVEGRVVADSVGLDPGVAKPFSGAQITLRTPGSKLGGGEVIGTAVSGSDGRFSLTVFPGRPRVCSSLLSLDLRAPDYTLQSSGGFDPGDCRGTTDGLEFRLIPDPVFHAAVPADEAACRSRPPGTICLGFEDGFTWMVETPGVRGWREGRPFQDEPVTVAVGHAFEFHHVLNTDQVARVRLP